MSVSFQQLKMQFVDSVQHDYEMIRPIVLFAEPVAARSQEVELPRSTVGDKARRFVQEGMLGLVDQRTTSPHHPAPFPERVAAYLLTIKQQYPPLHYRELARILKHKFGYQTTHQRIKRFLERHPIPVQLELDVPAFHSFEDAYRARWMVVRLYYEGWNKKSIAGYLKLSRTHVHHLIGAFKEDGFIGLEDRRTRPPNHPANQLTLPLLKELLDLQQQYPRAGRFRLQGLLAPRVGAAPSERTVGRAMALNREYHDAPPAWASDITVEAAPVLRHLPYRPQFRHHLWFVDIRYLVQLDGRWVYSLCLIEGYSRKILAGMASRHQDEIAVLQILRAALAEYGCPSAIVSDNGKVFQSRQYCRILAALGIQPLYIERGKPWQNLIEAQYKIQLRLADHNFEQAQSMDEIQDYHAEFVETFNQLPHGAHQEREDGRTSPHAVLEWVQGRPVEASELDLLFRQLQWSRLINQHGFVSIQRFYLYAERGLARRRVLIWFQDNHLQIAYRQTPLASYRYHTRRKRNQWLSVTDPILYDTEFASPQLEFWELDDEQWLKIRPRPYRPRPQRIGPEVEQLALFRLASYLLLLTPCVATC